MHRGEAAYVVLNLYPYNSGHLLVVPYRHVADYTELTAEEVAEIAALTQTAMRAVRTVVGCARLQHRHEPGQIAGAGIAAHLHQHVVPRWAGDANFCPSSRTPRPCRSCCPTLGRCSPSPGRPSPDLRIARLSKHG